MRILASMSSRDYFLGKRIALVGIGPQGEMLADIKFLVKAGALVSVYDLRSEAKLLPHLSFLRSIGLANLICGSVPAEDLLDMDIVILSHEYPRTSSFLAHVSKTNTWIEYPETLFLKLAPPVSVIGVMGVCGKSTLISILAPMMDAICKREGVQKSVVIDFESGDGIVSRLKNVKSGDVVIMRIDEHIMNEIVALKWSPHIAVFASTPFVSSDNNSTARKGISFGVLAHQTYNNYVIGDDHVIDLVRASGFHSKAKLLRTKSSIVKEDWMPIGTTAYDRENAAIALETARLFKIADEVAQELLIQWKPLPYRLQMFKKVRGVEFWNDATSISPISTAAALDILGSKNKVTLIIGGADRGADFRDCINAIKKYAHSVITLPGSGMLRERKHLHDLEGVTVSSAPSLEEAVRMAMDKAVKGDRVLYSPAFPAGGIDASRIERGERFVRAVRAL